MRRIEKGPEPACLEEIRQTPGVNWDSASGKQEMRDALWAEQKGLCAYCMSRLNDKSQKGMKIEHFIPRANDKDKTFWFAWSNLLGVCLGDMGVENARDRFHCDTHRGHLPTSDQELHVHPAKFPPDAGKLFACTREGELIPAKTLDDATRGRVQGTIDKLNLNISRLKSNRKAVLTVLQNRLRQKDSPTHIRQMLDDSRCLDASGRLMAYAEIAVQYLEKKLRQHSKA
jgi:uncharacterized protein (TIGR02646 family)